MLIFEGGLERFHCTTIIVPYSLATKGALKLV